MASTPTTKSQVQAYRFVLRRMESALVRKDAVMLHDPMGSHKRAMLAGAALAAIGVIGFLVWGLFGGKGTVPEAGNIVIAKESGSVFVVTSDDRAQKRLVPMLNMASAKLLVMAQGGQQGSGAVPTTTVKEAALADFPRGPLTGMVNAPTYLPSADNPAEPSWAICDVGNVANVADSQVETATKVETTVIGGDGHHGTEMAPEQSLYVRDQSSGDEYLIYRVQLDTPGRQHTYAVRAKVPQNDQIVRDIYGLNSAKPRTISTNMLNAIPSVRDLTVPQLRGSGPLSYMPRYTAGDVVKRTVAGEEDQYFVLLPSGKEQISAGAAAVLHAAKTNSRDIPNATGWVTKAPDVNQSEKVDLSNFPIKVPKPVSFEQADTSCLSWKNVNGAQNITVTLNHGSPAVKPAVKLAQYDGPGPNVDYYYGPAGKAAVVRGTSNEAGAGSGPIFLVSDQGVQYGIKDVATAQGLGVIKNAWDIKAGPSWLMRSLPRGDFLDPANASMTYDSVPISPGGVNRPPAKKQAAAAGS